MDAVNSIKGTPSTTRRDLQDVPIDDLVIHKPEVVEEG